jgi:hypothetical protein
MFGGRNVSRVPLFFSAVLFFISWYLPSPLIEGKNTQFITHFVGGGVFCGVLWLYIRNALNFSQNLFFDLVAMYFLTSGLGVANELFEFTLTKMHIMRLTPADTWWDLTANTMGVFSFWLAYSVYKIVRK